eukprot:751048-Amorphochlora_amoeboformis.AAC.1
MTVKRLHQTHTVIAEFRSSSRRVTAQQCDIWIHHAHDTCHIERPRRPTWMGVSADENFHGREKEGLLGSVVGDDEAKKSRKSRGEKEGANLIEGHTPEADELGEKARHKPHQAPQNSFSQIPTKFRRIFENKGKFSVPALKKSSLFWNLALLALTFSCAQSTMAGHLTISPLIVTNFGYSKLATVP